ncbi:dTDP-glucose 4,6-dehydratase [Candidatus Sumerlaeota bacterium]|nr:dTDP-glucose 4,6-dehydratase [Candidatus Sumerlaeota bacterium]
MDTMIVTGGAGFIGTNFVRHALAHTECRVVVFDKLTYAGNLCSLAEVNDDSRYAFVEGDIADRETVERLFREHRPTRVVNFAAETHVDRSIDDPRPFVFSNLVGVYELLETSRRFLAELDEAARERFRFLHVSTDEVYGSLGPQGLFSETTPYAPNSPYAATKAGADHLVRAYFKTYGVPALITNCSNNYGPFQYPEKFIPLALLNLAEGKTVPIYGDGSNVRDWLYVEDHCAGIQLALERGKPGEKYNIGGSNEHTNLEVIDHVCAALEAILPASENPVLVKQGIAAYSFLKKFVQDRPAHDKRYAIDASKIRRELGWTPAHDFASGIERTVRWYLEHRDWCEEVQSGKYRRERLGLKTDGR